MFVDIDRMKSPVDNPEEMGLRGGLAESGLRHLPWKQAAETPVGSNPTPSAIWKRAVMVAEEIANLSYSYE